MSPTPQVGTFADPRDAPEPAGTLGAMLRESMARHASRVALWVDGRAVTYQELSARAAAIAGALAEAGLAGPGRRCAVLGARSLSAFAGVAGALLAGSAYVPLNPRHPAARLAQALAAAEADALVVDVRSAAAAREPLGLTRHPVLVLMPDAPAPPAWGATLPHHRFLCGRDLTGTGAGALRPGSPQDGAYLLFTSGSTGAPKGVLVRQANVAAYLRSAAERYRPGPEDRFTQLFDLTFDLSVHDLFLCWGAGAALYCPPEGARMAPREFVRRNALTFWFSVPSTAAFMARLRLLRPGDFPTLRWSLFCGEALPRRIAESWAAAAPNSLIENLYGPTEATIAITAFRLPRDPAAIARLPDIVPIGTPLPGQQAVVLREDGSPAAAGEDGELFLGGSQVADGYWRRPDLTAERFRPPAGSAPGTQWYRTGDRARLAPGHGLLFLGRMDRQVKIGGHRVELQEVEAALRHAAGCDSAAAMAWPADEDGFARGIVAFVTEEAPANETVLDACRRSLPPYMVPSRVHRVAEWPVNDNGKTDYARLRRMVE
ncbi:amino acid adenylation domain-containing protein [Caldovatus aquaticus]|uniref:Amino acid adenylation domain-containing protein n=1 Tax=Caldovatus aquaticus TaxID=2865671 RepID=A0ABS7EZ71_9PROT|nr:amino acid adenylation domain-containing protein [Caldovatus aquaticus]MBW8268685.1 amino acid adenylation domain-containing protein [Caldovatus aquaticus]